MLKIQLLYIIHNARGDIMFKKIKNNIPNFLSTIRLAIALGLLGTINSPLLINNPLLLLPIYIVGASTDLLDGYLARRWNVQSKYGRRVDPIADKLLNITTLLIITRFSQINLLYLPLFSELGIAVASSATSLIHKKDITVANIGRLKTGLLCTTIVASLGLTKIPQLKNIVYTLIGSTVVAQGLTIYNYQQQYKNITKQEKKEENIIINNIPPTQHNKDKINEYKKLKDLLINNYEREITPEPKQNKEHCLTKEFTPNKRRN